MTYDELVEKIYNSYPEDWVSDADKVNYTYKDDVCLRIEKIELDEGIFNEKWATKHADPNAKKVRYIVYYNNSSILSHDLVYIDGYRSILPIPPKFNSDVITKKQYAFANVINGEHGNNLDEYLKRSKISVE